MTEQPVNVNVDADARASLIRQLFAANRGQKCDDASLGAYLLAVRRMDTPRLARVVEKILGGMESDAEPYRVPQPGRLWQVAKELRTGAVTISAPALKLEPTEPPAVVDGWTQNAAELLLAWITDPRARRAARYAPDTPSTSVGSARMHPGKVTILYTGILRKWAQLWARDMREDREDGGKLDGRALWLDYMTRADAEIAEHERAAA